MTLFRIDTIDSGKAVFQVLGNDTTAHEGLEYIIVNLDGLDYETHFKKGLVVEMLDAFAGTGTNVDWKYLDKEIAQIMNARVHNI